MTTSSTTNRVKYAGNGVTTIFSFPYYFVTLADFIVKLTDDVTGVITDPAFTVSGVADSKGVYSNGGSITCTVAPPAGKTLAIIRSPSRTQLVDFTDNRNENAFDKLTLLVQRLYDQVSRSVGMKDGDITTFDPTLPSVLTPNYALVVKGDGSGFEMKPTTPTTGTVTSVGLNMPGEFSVSNSPVTGAGTLTVTRATQVKNKILAGPTTGADAAPTFRSLVLNDLPAIPVASLSSGAATNGQVPTADGAGNVTWSSVGAGTVTSVGMSVPSFLSVSGSPVTGSGTLAVTLATQVKNRIFAGPNTGGDATPTFRSLVGADLPVFEGSDPGAVPASVNTDKFLRGDGVWASVPAGTVTSVGLTTPAEFLVTGNPVTGSGTLVIAKANQAANKIYAGPVSGLAAVPTFRSLVNADIPLMVGATSETSGTRGAVPAANAGQEHLFLRADGSWQEAAGGGSGVISYALASDLPVGAADGALAMVIETRTLYEYDTAAATWNPIGSTGFKEDLVFDGIEVLKNVNVSDTIVDARNCIWQLCDLFNDGEIMGVTILKTSASNVRIVTDPALPAGNYRLIGKE